MSQNLNPSTSTNPSIVAGTSLTSTSSTSSPAGTESRASTHSSSTQPQVSSGRLAEGSSEHFHSHSIPHPNFGRGNVGGEKRGWEPGAPFPVGHDDLDPLGGRGPNFGSGSGGMLVGPNHPAFGGVGPFPGRGGHDFDDEYGGGIGGIPRRGGIGRGGGRGDNPWGPESFGLPEPLPPGSVPPGARFDPFGPPINPTTGGYAPSQRRHPDLDPPDSMYM